MYSTFAAEVIQPASWPLTFAHVRHCSCCCTVDCMYITHPTHENQGRIQMVLRNQDSSGQKLNVVERGKEFCVQLRWVFVESCSQTFTVYANACPVQGVLHNTVGCIVATISHSLRGAYENSEFIQYGILTGTNWRCMSSQAERNQSDSVSASTGADGRRTNCGKIARNP